jgi:hypothetical protein
MTFFIAMEGRVRQSVEGDRRQRCGFNASVSPREGRRWDEALSEDEVKAASLSWLNEMET